VLLNNDAVVTEGWLEQLIALGRAVPRLAEEGQHRETYGPVFGGDPWGARRPEPNAIALEVTGSAETGPPGPCEFGATASTGTSPLGRLTSGRQVAARPPPLGRLTSGRRIAARPPPLALAC